METRIMERPPGKDMWQRGNGEKVVMREYDNENTRDDVETHQYEKPRWGASKDRKVVNIAFAVEKYGRKWKKL